MDVLAHRYPSLLPDSFGLEQATKLAPSEIARILRHYGRINATKLAEFEVNRFRKECNAVVSQASKAGRHQEALCLQLLCVDLVSPLPTAYQQFPPSEQLRGLELGYKCCLKAITLSKKLRHEACCAYYQMLRAHSGYKLRQYEEAKTVAQKALTFYMECQGENRSQQGKPRIAPNPQLYRPFLALAHRRLSSIERQLRQFDSASKHGTSAIRIFADLAKRHKAYIPELAMARRIQASVRRELQDDKEAEKLARAAVAVYRTLYREQPEQYGLQLGMTLMTLASIIKNRCPRRALILCQSAHKLYTASPEASHIIPHVQAMLDYTIGDIERSRGNYAASITAYDNALKQYEDAPLAAYPHIFERYSGIVQRNKGMALREAGRFDEGSHCFEEAIQIFAARGMWIEGATAYSEYATMKGKMGNLVEMEEFSRYSIQWAEYGLQRVDNHSRSIVKHKISLAYRRSIENHARLVTQSLPTSEESKTAKLVLIQELEALRRAEALSHVPSQKALLDSSQGDIKILRELTSGYTEVVDLLQQKKSAFIWIQVGYSQLIFVTLQSGQVEVHTAPLKSLKTLRSLSNKFTEAANLFRSFTRTEVSTHTKSAEMLKQRLRHQLRQLSVQGFDQVAEEAFQHLKGLAPAALMSSGHEIETIFLAPCAETINLPFELLRDPEIPKPTLPGVLKRSSPHLDNLVHNPLQMNYDAGYVGLSRSIARVHSLTELIHIISVAHINGSVSTHEIYPKQEARPNRKTEETKVPSHGVVIIATNSKWSHLPALPNVGRTGTQYAGVFRRKGFKSRHIRDPDLRRLKHILSQKPPLLWWHMTHGAGTNARDGAFIALKEHDKLAPHHLIGLNLRGTIVHHDCCDAAFTSHIAGRFSGFAAAALQRGAACVLSSFHTQWEDTAAIFSTEVYDRLLEGYSQDIGQAVLETRRALARHPDFFNNPLVWGLLTVWGCPWVNFPL